MQQSSDGKDRFDRRAFCKAGGAATAVGVVEASLGSVLAHADLSKEQRDKMTADEIIQQMKAGNEQFRSDKPQDRDLLREAKATAKGQYAAVIVCSCVDSRAPAELIFDFGIGDIFSGRVAGNVADEDILGSMEFACKVADSKVVKLRVRRRSSAKERVTRWVSLRQILSRGNPTKVKWRHEARRSLRPFSVRTSN